MFIEVTQIFSKKIKILFNSFQKVTGMINYLACGEDLSCIQNLKIAQTQVTLDKE